MKRKSFFTGIFLVILIPVAALGQANWQTIDENRWELILSGSGSSDNNFDGTIASFEGALGYYLTPGWELSLRQGVGMFLVDDGDDDWNGSTRAALDYHLCLGRFRPFLGVNFGYIYGDRVKDQFIAGPEGGIKFHLSPSTFLTGMVEYQVLFRDADRFDDNFDDGRFVYTLGLGFRW